MIQRIVLRRFLFVGVVAASLTLAAPGSAGATQPSRPLKLKGVATVVQTGMGFDAEGHVVIPWQLRATGEGTHVGRYTVEGAGVVTIDPATGAVTNESSGTITAASGDAIDFTGDFLDPSTVLLHLLGGTGRFEDAEGVATQSLTLVSQDGATSVYRFEIVGDLKF